MKTIRNFSWALTLLAFAACGKDGNDKPQTDYQDVLTNLSKLVPSTSSTT